MKHKTLSRFMCKAALLAASLFPAATIALEDVSQDIDYSKVENTILGHALYTRLHNSPEASMGILINADKHNMFGKDKALALIFLGDQLNEQGLKNDALNAYYSAIQSAKKDKTGDHARLHYARVKHELGQHELAHKVVNEIDDDNLSKAQKTEYGIIKAHALLRESKIEEAIDELPSIRNSTLWALYQRYNFGSELLGTYNNKNGASILHDLSKVDDDNNPEILALKDQSNLVLGFSLLKINKSKKARGYFQQVRLNASMSSMALLGMGWSYAIDENYEKALVYWLELQSRSLSGPYGYESSLAIPYAFGRANAYQQSISFYKAALNRFETDIAAMDAAKPAIKSGLFINMLSQSPDDETAWVSTWELNADSPEKMFLPLFMDNPEFQRHLQEYRELLMLREKVARMYSEVTDLEVRSGGTLSQLRQKHKLLTNAVDYATKLKQPILQRIALNILDSYQSELNSYLQQTRLGMAQAIEKASMAFEPE